MTQDTITITYAQLQAEGACADQLALFKERFGDSVTITRDDAGDTQFKFYAIGALQSHPEGGVRALVFFDLYATQSETGQ